MNTNRHEWERPAGGLIEEEPQMCERRCEIDRQRRFYLDHLIANTSMCEEGGCSVIPSDSLP